MRQKIKLNLEDLQIKSFTTSIGEVKGGAIDKTGACPKVSQPPQKCEKVTDAGCTQ